jgi:hypothetical protein
MKVWLDDTKIFETMFFSFQQKSTIYCDVSEASL